MRLLATWLCAAALAGLAPARVPAQESFVLQKIEVQEVDTSLSPLVSVEPSDGSVLYTLRREEGPDWIIRYTWTAPPTSLPPGVRSTLDAESEIISEGSGFGPSPRLRIFVEACGICGSFNEIRRGQSGELTFRMNEFDRDDVAIMSLNLTDGGGVSGDLVQYTYQRLFDDCCTAHGGQGCSFGKCADCVLTQRSSCGREWDEQCAALARTSCPDSCFCEDQLPTDCCQTEGCGIEQCHACVSGAGARACDIEWSAECASAARAQCSAECVCEDLPTPDCCEATGEPGCPIEACDTCNELPPEGCDRSWNESCAAAAREFCAEDCLCEDVPQDCCAGHGGRGCGLPACEACVVPSQPQCETEWTDECAELAGRFCSTACLCGPVASVDCCSGDPVATAKGCGSGRCEACVCADPNFADCCRGVWNDRCSVAAQSAKCAQSCSCTISDPDSICCGAIPPDPREQAGCVDRGCELCVCSEEQSSACCDGTWTADCAEVANQRCAGECSCRDPQDCCDEAPTLGPMDAPLRGCEQRNCEVCVCSDPDLAACCSGAWTAECAIAAAARCNDDCGCVEEPQVNCCLGSEHFPPGAPLPDGCEERDCMRCVCTDSPECCSGEWNAACAAQANGRCVDLCGCKPPSIDCCAGGVPLELKTDGCDDRTCALCVCEIEEDCCSGGWDTQCVERALGQCNLPCQCPEVFELGRVLEADDDLAFIRDITGLPHLGVLQIGDEQIRYAGFIRPEQNPSTGFARVAERGFQDTPASSHFPGDPVLFLTDADPTVPGDANCNGILDRTVDEIDALNLSVFGRDAVVPCPGADANTDGTATAADYSALLLLER